MNVTSLTDLAGDGDVLQELLTRIEQLEAQDTGGYGPCLAFYKRIAKRIEDADNISLEAKDRASRAYGATQNDEAIASRLWEDMEFFEAYLVTLEDDKERRNAEAVELGDRFIYTHNGAYVEVTRLFGGRWKYAELRIVDCGSMFNSEILVHDLQDNKYGFWEKTV
jgi:hypothetical protein